MEKVAPLKQKNLVAQRCPQCEHCRQHSSMEHFVVTRDIVSRLRCMPFINDTKIDRQFVYLQQPLLEDRLCKGFENSEYVAVGANYLTYWYSIYNPNAQTILEKLEQIAESYGWWGTISIIALDE